MAKAASASAIGDKEKPKKNACILHAVIADLAALCLHLLNGPAYERVPKPGAVCCSVLEPPSGLVWWAPNFGVRVPP